MKKAELEARVKELEMKLKAFTQLGDNMKIEAGPGKVWIETEFGPAIFLAFAHMLIRSKAENYLEARFDVHNRPLPNGATSLLVTVCYQHGRNDRTPARVNAELKAENERLRSELEALTRNDGEIPIGRVPQ